MSDEEDDYMNMTFEDPTPAKETSLQRTQRLKKESLARGQIKSKAQIAEEEASAREKALSTSMLEDPRSQKSKGLAMMAKMGFTGGGLGKKNAEGESAGRQEPIRVSVKENRGGVGLDNEKKRRLRQEAEERGIKAVKLDPDEYRDRVRREREEARMEKQFYAAQRMAERMDEESDEQADSRGAETEPQNEETKGSQKEGTKVQDGTKRTDAKARPLKSINILYRGLIKHREEKERDKRMRHDLEQSLSRLPTYEDEDEDDEDYKTALGKNKAVYVTAEDLDEEDEELDEFNELEIATRLGKVLLYLREKHWYCFWCKMAYDNEEMEGCPGLTEEDHD